MDNKVLCKSFLWMAIGLLVTFLTGFCVCLNTRVFMGVINSYYLLAIIEFILVIVLSARITKFSATTARVMFLLYSFVSGLTFSSIFVVYSLGSIFYVFLLAAAIFGLMSLLGYFTKVDLSKFSTYIAIAFLVIIIAMIINIFAGGSTLALIITIAMLLLFIGVTAYDVQKIKNLPNFDAAPIYGALELYLDFINIFINLLTLFGKRDD